MVLESEGTVVLSCGVGRQKARLRGFHTSPSVIALTMTSAGG